MRDAAIKLHDMGYHLCAWPNRFGKYMGLIGTNEWVYQSFPAHLVNDKLNIGINHHLNKTCLIDVDNMEYTLKVFNYLGIDLHKLAMENMCWRGRDNTYKILFDGTGLSIPYRMLRNTDDTNSIFELKGLQGIKPSYESELHKRADLTYIKDTCPPSIHPTTKRPYTFLTSPITRDKLPAPPDNILQLWQNFDDYIIDFKKVIA